MKINSDIISSSLKSNLEQIGNRFEKLHTLLKEFTCHFVQEFQ